jgi:hypothetical protein
MGTYKDAMKRPYDAEFSTDKQPKVAMPIVTKIERVQPFTTGVNSKGELVWEGREMPRWQMELLRVAVDHFGEFFTHWLEVYKYEGRREEFRDDDGFLAKCKSATKERLAEMRRMYPAKIKLPRKVRGD